MNSPIENLPFGSKISAMDALASLSEATGLSDQDLQEKMPLLKGHQGTVTLGNISGANVTRIDVVLEGSNTTYTINFGDDELTISPFEHDDISDLQARSN